MPHAAVELIDDLEDRLLPLVAEGVCGSEQPPDSEMGLGAQVLPGSRNKLLPGRGHGETCRSRSVRKMRPARIASQSCACISSFDCS